MFLDIASRTGDRVKELEDGGYRAYGLESSKALISRCEQKYPDLEIRKVTRLSLCYLRRTHLPIFYVAISQFTK